MTPPPYRRTYRRRDTILGAENSEVLPAGSVAVAVTAPAAHLRVRKKIVASPSEPVLAIFWSIEVLPSSVAAGFEKTCTVKVLPGEPFSLPLKMVPSRPALAEARPGNLCRRLGPASESFSSLSVRPAAAGGRPRDRRCRRTGSG